MEKFQNPNPILKVIFLPVKLVTGAPLIMTKLPSEKPERDCKKLGDDIFPIGVPLLMILKRLLTLKLKLRVCLGGFLFFLSPPKPKDFERSALKSKADGPRPKLCGMIRSPGEGLGSSTPYFVVINPGLLRLAANDGRSL
jgi:hypothetical protein